MSIQSKLLWAFAGTTVLFMSAIFVSMILQQQSTTLSSLVQAENSKLYVIEKLDYQVRAADDDGAWYLLSTRESDKQTYMGKYNKDLAAIHEMINSLVGSSTNPTDIRDLNNFQQLWTVYMQGNAQAFAQFVNGDVRGAQAAYITVPFDPTIASLFDLRDRLSADIANQEAQKSSLLLFSTRLDWFFTIIALLFSAFIALLISRRISRLVRKVNDQLREIADGEGDLTRTITVSSSDEIGELAASFNRMIGKLGGRT